MAAGLDYARSGAGAVGVRADRGAGRAGGGPGYWVRQPREPVRFDRRGRGRWPPRASRCSSRSARTAPGADRCDRRDPGDPAGGQRRGRAGAVFIRDAAAGSAGGPAPVPGRAGPGARPRRGRGLGRGAGRAASGWTCRPTRSSISGTGREPPRVRAWRAGTGRGRRPRRGSGPRSRAGTCRRWPRRWRWTGRQPLREVLPALAAWRRRERDRSVTAGWRYRVTWVPVPDPGRRCCPGRGWSWSRPGWRRGPGAGVRAGDGGARRPGGGHRGRRRRHRPGGAGGPDQPGSGRRRSRRAGRGLRAGSAGWCRCWRWPRRRCRGTGGAGGAGGDAGAGAGAGRRAGSRAVVGADLRGGRGRAGEAHGQPGAGAGVGPGPGGGAGAPGPVGRPDRPAAGAG